MASSDEPLQHTATASDSESPDNKRMVKKLRIFCTEERGGKGLAGKTSCGGTSLSQNLLFFLVSRHRFVLAASVVPAGVAVYSVVKVALIQFFLYFPGPSSIKLTLMLSTSPSQPKKSSEPQRQRKGLVLPASVGRPTEPSACRL